MLGNNFEVIDARLNVTGGSLGDGAGAARSELVISGGTIGRDFDANAGSVVNLTGGRIGQDFDANAGSIVNISGGQIGEFLTANPYSAVNISGGTVSEGFDVKSGSVANISGGSVRTSTNIFLDTSSFDVRTGGVVNISGGTVGRDSRANQDFRYFNAEFGSEVNLFGTDSVLDGQPLGTLTPGQPVLITQRDVFLSGVLSDGTPFLYELSSTDSGEGFTHPNARLTVTLTTLPGDYNDDGAVDAADYTVWRDNFGEDVTLPGDMTAGAVTRRDYDVWFQNYGATTATSKAVPEPDRLLLILAALAGLQLPQRRICKMAPRIAS